MYTFQWILSTLLLLLLRIYIYIYIWSSDVGRKNRSNILFSRKKNQDHFNLTLPTLVVATFIVFNDSPIFVELFILNSPQDEFSTKSEIRDVMYILGWIADPLIYLCTQRNRLRPKQQQ